TWKSNKSKLKYCIKLGQITNDSENVVIIKKDIDLENLNSDTNFKIIFYVIKPGTQNGNRFFANQSGMVINDDINWTIVMEGQSSIFPIYEVAEENAPLWSFNCEVDD